MLDEQTAAVRPNADVTRVVAMLQSTAVLTELGGGSLWQHIDEALKASFEQCQPHVREAGLWRERTAERKSTVGPLRRYSAQSAAHADRRLRVSLSTDSTVNSAAAVRRSSARSSHHTVRQQTVICRRMGAPIGPNAAQQSTTIARVLRCAPKRQNCEVLQHCLPAGAGPIGLSFECDWLSVSCRRSASSLVPQ